MNMVGTPWRRCSAPPATVCRTASGSKPSPGIDHGRAVGDAGEVAQHHAEAVVERHGDAQPVVSVSRMRLADEEAVVEDVVVGQRGALGSAGGAAGELDVDRRRRTGACPRARPAGALLAARWHRAIVVEGEHAGRRCRRSGSRSPGSAAWRVAACRARQWSSSGASSRSMAR